MGTPAAAARCVGPVSAPTKRAARAARRAEEAGVVAGARRSREEEEEEFARRGEEGEEDEDKDCLERVISASARLSSPGPQRSTGWMPSAESISAKAIRSSAPHSLSTFEEKGCNTAKGRSPYCFSQSSTMGSSRSTRCRTSGTTLEAGPPRDVLGEREHLVEDVRPRSAVDVDVLVRGEAVDLLGGCPEAEADFPRRPNGGRDQRRFEEPLRVDDEIRNKPFPLSKKISYVLSRSPSEQIFPPDSRVRDEDLVDVRRAGEERSERAFDRPREARAREGGAQRFRRGKREDDVAEGREAHEEDPHPTHATLAGRWAILEPCSSLRCWF